MLYKCEMTMVVATPGRMLEIKRATGPVLKDTGVRATEQQFLAKVELGS
jgi:hypothetical protein